MSKALATTHLDNGEVVTVPLTIGELRLIEAALFDRGIMSSADAAEGRKTRDEHARLFEALQGVSDVIDSAVRSATRQANRRNRLPVDVS